MSLHHYPLVDHVTAKTLPLAKNDVTDLHQWLHGFLILKETGWSVTVKFTTY